MQSDWLLQSQLSYHPSRKVILHNIVVDEWTLCGPQTLITGTHWIQSMTLSELNELELLIQPPSNLQIQGIRDTEFQESHTI
jgi:hypothetical protein